MKQEDVTAKEIRIRRIILDSGFWILDSVLFPTHT